MKRRLLLGRKVMTNLAAAAAKLLQSRPTLCDPIEGSPPGSPIPGTLQARTLEWVAISFSNAWKWKVKVKMTNLKSILKIRDITLSKKVHLAKVMVFPISNHLISASPFSSRLQSFPASGPFPMSLLFTLGGPSIGVSASTSILPMNTQDWSPLGWTGWISLQSKGLSRVFSRTTVQKHQFFSAQPYLRRRQWHPPPVLLPGKSHGWRSLVGFSPWGR